MNTLHRKVAAGAFGGLAAVTAAGGIAFACSAVPSVRVSAPGTQEAVPVVQPNQVVDVRVNTFEAGETVVLSWDSPAGVSTFATATPLVGPSFTVSVTIPATAQPSRQPSYIIARQYHADGTLGTNAAAPMYMAGAVAAAPVTDQVVEPTQTVTPAPAVTSTEAPATVAAPTATPAPSATPATGAARPATAPAPAAAATKVTPQVAPATATATAPAPTASATQAPAPAGTPASPLTASAPVPHQPLAPASDLWSGLQADSTPSLLDTAAPQPATSSFPVGAVLLGSGLVALAGVAIATGRRQLATSRIVR